MSGDVAGFCGCQERHRTRNVVGCAGSSQRDFSMNRVLDFVGKSGGHVRSNKAGRYGVDSNIRLASSRASDLVKPIKPALLAA